MGRPAYQPQAFFLAVDADGLTNNEYYVEKIIARRYDAYGVLSFLVKWRYFAWADNSWEPIDNLINANEALPEFYAQLAAHPNVYRPGFQATANCGIYLVCPACHENIQHDDEALGVSHYMSHCVLHHPVLVVEKHPDVTVQFPLQGPNVTFTHAMRTQSCETVQQFFAIERVENY